jgi:hypothetical protein
MKRRLLVALFAWYVVTYSGQRVAGPFTLLSECSEMAKIMAERYFNISEICRAS